MANIIMSMKKIFRNMLHNQKGASDSILITIIGIAVGATVMFVFPLMAVSERNDDIAQSLAQTATAEFGDKIAISGVINPSDYNEYEQKLLSTGNTFEITIEVQHLDENFGKKNSATSGDLIGENQRYSTFYSNGIPDEGIVLKKGDNVIFTFKNTNTTMARTFRTFAYKVAGKGAADIAGSYSTMVVNNGTIN